MGPDSGCHLKRLLLAKRCSGNASRRQGSIILTSSIAEAPDSGLTPYAASKGGIDQLVRTMAAEWATRGVRVNAVARDTSTIS